MSLPKYLSLSLFLLLIIEQTIHTGDALVASGQTTESAAEETKKTSYANPLFTYVDEEEENQALFPEKESMKFSFGSIKGRYQVKYKPETFFGSNIHRLNSKIDHDKILFSRHTLDNNLDFTYGEDFYGHTAVRLFTSFRIKAIWGNAGSIPVTSESFKILNTSVSEHSHILRLEVPRFREIWLSFNINDALQVGFQNQHYFQVGTFPFELGRGIAFGNAYLVAQQFLGFFSDNIIDQYAPGFKFYGDIIKDTLSYDIYGAYLENFSDSFRNTAARVYVQNFGGKRNAGRGFGKINFVVAGRMRWTPYAEKNNFASFEPYILANPIPEQKIEFIGDAKAHLGTTGFAAEFRRGNFECGFDTAFNFGGQHVRGVDRNVIKFENRVAAGNTPRIVEINNKVIAEEVTEFGGTPISTSKAVFIAKSDSQKAIAATPEDASQNGKLIGDTTFELDGKTVQLRNDADRFRNPYNTKFNGWMVIGDLAYTFDNVKAALMAGIASGDHNPHKNTDVNDTYSGFIGLQEIYSGDRVKSVYMLGGAGRAPRPTLSPVQEVSLDNLPTALSSFNNLVLVGGSLVWQPQDCKREFRVMPNILSYWTQTSVRAFDRVNGKFFSHFASRHLGVELNTFADMELFPDTKLYGVGSLFFPGKFYKDLSGIPLTPDEFAHLNDNSRPHHRKPLLSNDISYTLNIGIEIRI